MSPTQDSKELSSLLEKLPAQNYSDAERIGRALVQGGPELIKELVSRVGEFGDPGGIQPKYALHGLAVYASRPGADAEREMVARSLAGELEAGHPEELKAFLIRQLQLCGRPREVPVLKNVLPRERLCEPAAQALLAIGGKEAAAALKESLPGLQGKQRLTVQQAIDLLQPKAKKGGD